MASSINASTSGGGGIITTADASGNLNIQSGGSTVVAVTSTGATVTGTLAATGAVTASTTLAVTGASTFTGTGKFATTIGVGNATPSASGSGITFPATQSASSDANTLDDYEEGTWTPVVAGTTTAGAGTYITQVGTYVKVGGLVTVMCALAWSAHTGTGNIAITGLPYTSAATAGMIYTGGIYANEMNFGTAATQLTAFITDSSATVLFRGMINNLARADVPIDTAVGNLVVNISYRV